MSTAISYTVTIRLSSYVEPEMLSEEREVDFLDISLHVLAQLELAPFAAGGNWQNDEVYYTFWDNKDAIASSQALNNLGEAWGKTARTAYDLAHSLDNIRDSNKN